MSIKQAHFIEPAKTRNRTEPHTSQQRQLSVLQALCALTFGTMLSAAHAADGNETEHGFVEAGAFHHALDAGYPAWNGIFARGQLRTDERNLWNAEVVHAAEFGDAATVVSIGNRHDFTDRWYTTEALALSASNIIFPTTRVDLTANRRWLPGANFITTAGVTFSHSADGHADHSLLLAGTYYFDLPLVLETGIRFNVSNPGGVRSNYKYVVGTAGRVKDQLFSLRYAFGNEAYQYISPDALLVNFDSYTVTGTWRKWLNVRTGFQVRTELYHNPYYNRRGIELAAFREF